MGRLWEAAVMKESRTRQQEVTTERKTVMCHVCPSFQNVSSK